MTTGFDVVNLVVIFVVVVFLGVEIVVGVVLSVIVDGFFVELNEGPLVTEAEEKTQ